MHISKYRMRLKGYGPESDLECRADEVPQCHPIIAAFRTKRVYTPRLTNAPRPAASKSVNVKMMGNEYSNKIRARPQKNGLLCSVLWQKILEREDNKRESPWYVDNKFVNLLIFCVFLETIVSLYSRTPETET